MAEQSNPQVDINSANADTLANLPGISSKLAQNIIDRREEQPFETAEDIKSVKGISDKLFVQIQSLVTVADNDTADDNGDETGEEQADETAAENTEEDEISANEPDEEAVEGDTNDETDDEPTDDAEVDEAPAPEEAGDDESPIGEPVPEPSDEADVDEDSTDTPALVDNTNTTKEVASEESDSYVINWPGEDEAEETTAEVAEATAPQPAADSVDTPETDSQPAPAPQPTPASSTNSSDNFRRPWLLMLVGTLLGAFVALGALYLINDGVLVFANHPKVTQMESALSTLEEREVALNEKIEGLQTELTQLSSMKEQVETNLGDIKLIQQTDETQGEQLTILEDLSERLQDRASTIEERVSAVGKDVTGLQVTANKLTAAMEEVEEDTARFDGFLDGMRQLLIEAQE